MSHLVQLRQRITATQITQKTTNAMRLIAMSSHTRLRHIKERFDLYKNHIKSLWDTVRSLNEQTTAVSPSSSFLKPCLVIIIGSEKGLCGNFNTSMADYFQKHLPIVPENITTYTIVIGKQLKTLVATKNIPIDFSYDKLSSSNYRSLAQELTGYILSNNYSSAIIYYTLPKSFFVATHVQLVLASAEYTDGLQPNTLPLSSDLETYFSEQSYQKTYTFLSALSLNTTLEAALLDSLLAEQAARFLSMDAATRNADELINRMKLDYNKLRQAAITRELTDLSGSFATK